jgi:putative colanic acid biosynthesis UDP-glucose lipid carrier transferase
MYVYRKFVYSIRLGADLAGMFIAYRVAVLLSFIHAGQRVDQYLDLIFMLLLLVWIISSQITGLYDDFRSRDFRYEIIARMKTALVQPLAAAVILILVKETILARLFLVLYSSSLVVLIGAEKFVLGSTLKILRRRGRNLRSLLVIGAGRVGLGFADAVARHTEFGYRIIGFLDDKKVPSLNGSYLGPISKLEAILTDRRIDNVVVALPNSAYKKVEEIVRVCEDFTTTVRIIPNYSRFLSTSYSFSMFDRYPIISPRDEKLAEFHWRIAKRAFDTGFTLLLFALVFWWLWPIIALAIKLTSPGPVFFKQIREGRYNRTFVAYKFRSMVCCGSDVDENGKYQQAAKGDRRITTIGKILRKTNLDELPQFINVLKGEMSIVGPRPHPLPLDVESKAETRMYMQRYLVKPGITGWAQVNGHRGETREPMAMQRRVNSDLWYIENWSFWLDLRIILKTIFMTVKGDPHAY